MMAKTSGSKVRKTVRRGGGCEISTITFDLDLTEEQELKFRKLCRAHKLKFPDGLSVLLEKVAQPYRARKPLTVGSKPKKSKAKA